MRFGIYFNPSRHPMLHQHAASLWVKALRQLKVSDLAPKQYTAHLALDSIICHKITCQDRFHTSAGCPIIKCCMCVVQGSMICIIR